MPRPLVLSRLYPAASAIHGRLLLLLLFIAAMAVLENGGDRWWADHLYALQGGSWRYRDAWWTSQLLHTGGKWLSVGASVLVAAGALWAWLRPGRAHWRRPLIYLLLSVALSTSLISLIKSTSAVACPWDLTRYGGQQPWLGLIQAWQTHGPVGGCFPAGHASAGYAWLALYFLAAAHAPQWRWPALLLGLGLGACFGLAQQLRGAHFASHDLASLALCWLCARTLAGWLLPPTLPPTQTPALNA